MTCAIGYVIYGIPLNEEHSDLIRGWENGEEVDPETDELRRLTDEEAEELWFETRDGPCGFTSVYSGSSPNVTGYCGVVLGKISEGNDIHLDAVNWKATPEQKKEALEKISALHPKLQAAAQIAGHYIVWGSS